MTSALSRRLSRVERITEEARRAPVRERVHRIMRRLDVHFSPTEVEGVVTRHLGMQERAAQLRRDGLSNDQIFDVLVREISARTGI